MIITAQSVIARVATRDYTTNRRVGHYFIIDGVRVDDATAILALGAQGVGILPYDTEHMCQLPIDSETGGPVPYEDLSSDATILQAPPLLPREY